MTYDKVPGRRAGGMGLELIWTAGPGHRAGLRAHHRGTARALEVERHAGRGGEPLTRH